MHYLYRAGLVVLAIASLIIEPGMAQTAAIAPPTVARKQDREECAAKAASQGITKRIRVSEFIRKCMADKIAGRNMAERKRLREEWTSELKEAERRKARAAACKNEARQQKLHFKNRSVFIKECMTR
jgi:hypothetical protein